MDKPIAILGSGPAAMLVAHALALHERPFTIISNGEKSRLGGAQFLHLPIPGLHHPERPDCTITYRLRGSEYQYREKLYGAESVPFVSMSDLKDGQTQDGWSLIKTYDLLWDIFSPSINSEEVNAQWIDDHKDEFRAILSTIPLPAICRVRAGLAIGRHDFHSKEIKIHPGNIEPLPDNTILYDGTRDRSWYRTSLIMGVGGTEWSGSLSTPPGIDPVMRDRKPISTNCNCWGSPDNVAMPAVVRLGRRGSWEKGVLTHHAFLIVHRMCFAGVL